MFVDFEVGECQVAIPKSQDVGDDFMVGQEMQNEDYDLRNGVLSDDNDIQGMKNVDQDMLRQGVLSRYLTTLLKPQNVVWKPKIGSQATK